MRELKTTVSNVIDTGSMVYVLFDSQVFSDSEPVSTYQVQFYLVRTNNEWSAQDAEQFFIGREFALPLDVS